METLRQIIFSLSVSKAGVARKGNTRRKAEPNMQFTVTIGKRRQCRILRPLTVGVPYASAPRWRSGSF
jgi:hypothetical protein